MFTDGSGPVGGVVSYVRIVTTLETGARRALLDGLYGAYLSSPGTVDANAITRGQYIVPDGSSQQPRLTGSAGFAFSNDDVTANPDKALTGTLFIAPASAFASGTVPTPEQIRLAATEVVRATSTMSGSSIAYRTTAGNIDLAMIPATATARQPNTKLWLMICPTAVSDFSSTPSIANDVPLGGNANTHGRAVSAWTNRTPLAPVITTPNQQTVVFPGSSVTLAFSPRDPDRVQSYPGDSGIPDFEDMAGVQFQHRRRAALGEPEQEWVDLPIRNTAGTTYGNGWYMDDLTVNSGNEGARSAWLSQKLVIECGDMGSSTANAAFLASGDWEVRVRTFDYGHGRPDSANLQPPTNPGVPPLGDFTRSYTPDNYPEVNTSPWSEPVRIFINPQVPKPLAVTPSNNIAIVEGTGVTLTWQYRNTYSPPKTQATRTVQIRRTGDLTWTTLADEASAANTYPVTSHPLVSGNQYAWRVKVSDTSEVQSEWSDPAYFWIVPEPASGDIIPTPGEIIDGATLGCGTHRVEIYRRGGKVRVGEVTQMSSIQWGRTRDDISTARIVVSGWSEDCGALLADLQAWAYEIVIFRDNGQSVDRVWEGPITLLTYEWDTVTIQAKDVMAYLYRRIIKQTMNDSGNSPTAGDSVTSRAARVVMNTLAADDPNLLSYLIIMSSNSDAKQYRSVPAYGRTAFEEIDDMAANAGLDYTAVGRSIVLWGTRHRIGTLPEFTDADLGASPIVSEYGMSMANRYAVSDGNGVWGEATRLDGNGQDPIYGLVEMLSSTWASESVEESGTYTQEGVETIRESFAESAERSIGDRYPPPVVVRIPDNTRLNPDTVLSIQHLVPGVVIPLRSTGTLRSVVADQKLDSITVTETAGVETVTVTMSPFSREDTEVVAE